ncbi:MAG TPA: hypothetical protein ENN29_04135, partial [Candidatus Hydrogenedentes bacterium]|nr:hypothetical protein [Candidatus Hydrogenedentota bacterium]
FHLAAFAGVHGFFKLVAFYAAVQGNPAGRIRALPWLALAGVSCVVGYGVGERYWEYIQLEQPRMAAEIAPHVVGDTFANAFPAPENTRMIMAMEDGTGEIISFYCAPLRGQEEKFPDTIFVILEAFDGIVDSQQEITRDAVASIRRTVTVEENGWTEFRLNRSDIPKNTESLILSWSEGEEDSIEYLLGLAKNPDSGRTLLVSGPWQHTSTIKQRSPGVVIVVIEGLGAENMSLYGYHRNTTPFLDERAGSMIVYEEAYTPSPHTQAACMSVLTGLNPLAHRYYESLAGPLPEGVKTLPEILRGQGYHTIAFTEGRGPDAHDLHYGSGFERGFILFNDYFPTEIHARNLEATTPARPVPAGAWLTLQNAADWIENHGDNQFLVFIRLRELRNPVQLPRYGNGFIGHGRVPDPVDIYDTAVMYVDKQVSAFIDRIHNMPEGQRPVLIITSSYGFDFTEPGRGAWRRGGPPRRTLHESSLRIPLLLDVPARYGSVQKHPVSLEDAAVTVAALTNVNLPHDKDGVNILGSAGIRECISMTGDPIALSMRTGRWRFTWQSGLSPYTMESVEPPTVIEFIDVSRYRSNLAPVDNIRREPKLVEAFTQQLRTFLYGYQRPNETIAAPIL